MKDIGVKIEQQEKGILHLQRVIHVIIEIINQR